MKLTAALEMKNDVGMRFGRMRPAVVTEPSAHAQMDDESPAAIEMPDQVFGAPFKSIYTPACQRAQIRLRRKRPPQPGDAGFHSGNHPASDMRGQAPANRLDFRQLRHLTTPSRPVTLTDASCSPH